MSCDPFEWTCVRCGKAWPDSYHVSYPREFWKDNKKQTGDVCEECRNELDNKQEAFAFGDWVVYDPGYKQEIGRVTEDKDKFVGVCYHTGCTASFTDRQYLRPATEAEIQSAPHGLGFHRFDFYCPDAKSCPKFGRCDAQAEASDSLQL